MKIDNAIFKIIGKKNILTTILPSIVIIGIYSIFAPSYLSKKFKADIKQLKEINATLKHKNDSILYQVENIKIDMERSDEIIKSLFDESETYKIQLQSINTKYSSLKSKYEKANSHSDSFTSHQISEYFSNLK